MKKDKYILILSQDNDISTIDVLKWLIYWKIKFIRVNASEKLRFNNLSYQDGELEFCLNYIFEKEQFSINFKDIKSFWFRRGRLNLEHSVLPEDGHDIVFEKSVCEIITNLENENKRLVDLISYNLNYKIKSLGIYQNYHNNKLLHHIMAEEIGLKVPVSYVFTDKKSAQDLLMADDKKFIIKPISDTPWIRYKKDGTIYTYILYSTDITLTELELFPEFFFPTLFQLKIEKAFEIRSFFMKDIFYSMAILSQKDDQTKTDFRNYNEKKPNRWVPFNLPAEIVDKLKKFMEKVGLDTGSIDLIYSPNGDYHFLEVNPVGQFGMVSGPCNYEIERKIATFLAF